MHARGCVGALLQLLCGDLRLRALARPTTLLLLLLPLLHTPVGRQWRPNARPMQALGGAAWADQGGALRGCALRSAAAHACMHACMHASVPSPSLPAHSAPSLEGSVAPMCEVHGETARARPRNISTRDTATPAEAAGCSSMITGPSTIVGHLRATSAREGPLPAHRAPWHPPTHHSLQHLRQQGECGGRRMGQDALQVHWLWDAEGVGWGVTRGCVARAARCSSRASHGQCCFPLTLGWALASRGRQTAAAQACRGVRSTRLGTPHPGPPMSPPTLPEHPYERAPTSAGPKVILP